MKRIIRIILMIVVLLAIVGLARSQAASAAQSSSGDDQLAEAQADNSVSPGKDDYCDKEKNKDKPECKNKDKCKKHKEQCGSVKPPPTQILILVTGEYSVGGFCTLSVELYDPEIQLDARVITPLPGTLPDDVQKVRQGCLLTYYKSNQRIDELPTDAGNTTICFAATPAGKQITLYFYDLYSPDPKWAPLETTVDSGKACAEGNASGVYIATFQQH